MKQIVSFWTIYIITYMVWGAGEDSLRISNLFFFAFPKAHVPIAVLLPVISEPFLVSFFTPLSTPQLTFNFLQVTVINANLQDLQTQMHTQLQNARSRPGSSGSWVDPPSRPGFVRSLHRPVFKQTRTNLATGSAGSQVDPPDRSGFNNTLWTFKVSC
jgi:hypothetical protein